MQKKKKKSLCLKSKIENLGSKNRSVKFSFLLRIHLQKVSVVYKWGFWSISTEIQAPQTYLCHVIKNLGTEPQNFVKKPFNKKIFFPKKEKKKL